MTENWLAGFANYESWIGDSENEGSPDLDRVFADAHDFQMARAAEAAQATKGDPPRPRRGPAATKADDALGQEGAPTAPHVPMEDATRAANAAAFIAAVRPLFYNAPPGDPAHDETTWDPSLEPRVCGGPSERGRDSALTNAMPHECDDTKLIESEPEVKVLASKLTKPWLTAAGHIKWHPDPRTVALRHGLDCTTRDPSDRRAATSTCSDHGEALQAPEDATDALEGGQARVNEQGQAAANPLSRRQWPFPQIAARENERDPIEDWDKHAGGATLREDPPMPKAARRNRAWVGAQAPLEAPTRGQDTQEASSATSARPAQASDGTRATETGPGREMLSTVEEPG